MAQAEHASEGTSASKRAKSDDTLSGKQGESSTSVMGKIANEGIDKNICFVTFEAYMLEETGAEWLPCPCRRWLHEHCAQD